MKICLAQTKPVRGAIDNNVKIHITLIEEAAAMGADGIIFPELSLTGYEPSLAAELAMGLNDERLNPFQQISNEKHITIGVGMPVTTNMGIHIGMVLFQPGQPQQLYAKRYLHADEEPFFTSGENYTGVMIKNQPVAIAICYELSIPQHAADAHKRGDRIYIASVAKTASGVEKAQNTLAATAGKYSMMVLLVNSVGMCEDGLCTGTSCAWNNKGQLLGQLDAINEGLLLVDAAAQEVIIPL
jgi:predicted amidohydrolase